MKVKCTNIVKNLSKTHTHTRNIIPFLLGNNIIYLFLHTHHISCKDSTGISMTRKDCFYGSQVASIFYTM